MNLNATLFAQVVVFFILAWVTMRYVWPPVLKALDDRAEHIRQSLDGAHRAEQEVTQLRSNFTAELQKERAVAQEVMQKARARADALIEEANAEAKRVHHTMQERAKADAALLVAKMKQEAYGEISDLVILGVEQVLKREVDPKAHAEVLNRLCRENMSDA